MTCDGILSFWTGLLADVDRNLISVRWRGLRGCGKSKSFARLEEF
ncbi:MAG: hypothetical protein ACOC5D_07640 [Thermoplasmatota archaeon]